jgi:hypothetical protein
MIPTVGFALCETYLARFPCARCDSAASDFAMSRTSGTFGSGVSHDAQFNAEDKFINHFPFETLPASWLTRQHPTMSLLVPKPTCMVGYVINMLQEERSALMQGHPAMIEPLARVMQSFLPNRKLKYWDRHVPTRIKKL